MELLTEGAAGRHVQLVAQRRERLLHLHEPDRRAALADDERRALLLEGGLHLRQGILLGPGLRHQHVLELRSHSIHELGHGARKKCLASLDHSRLHSTASLDL